MSSQTTSAEVKEDKSPLLRLPRELRDLIYGFSVLSSEIIFLHTTEEEDQLLFTGSPSPGLFQTCTQIRLEALECQYKDSNFMIQRHTIQRAALIQSMFFNTVKVAPKSLHIQIDNKGEHRRPHDVPWLRDTFIPSIRVIRDQCALAPTCKVTVTAYFEPVDFHQMGVEIDLNNLEEQLTEIETIVASYFDVPPMESGRRIGWECWDKIRLMMLRQMEKKREAAMRCPSTHI